MECYIYAADTWCEECGESIRARIKAEGNAPENPDDQCSYDSGDYPKGPYDASQEESDTPQHCAECGVFLKNPLTRAGVRYVAEMIRDNPDGPCTKEWTTYYAEELSRL